MKRQQTCKQYISCIETPKSKLSHIFTGYHTLDDKNIVSTLRKIYKKKKKKTFEDKLSAIFGKVLL